MQKSSAASFSWIRDSLRFLGVASTNNQITVVPPPSPRTSSHTIINQPLTELQLSSAPPKDLLKSASRQEAIEQEAVIQKEKTKAQNGESGQIDSPHVVLPSLLAFALQALFKDLDQFLKNPNETSDLKNLLNKFSTLGYTLSTSLIEASIRLRIKQHEYAIKQHGTDTDDKISSHCLSIKKFRSPLGSFNTFSTMQIARSPDATPILSSFKNVIFNLALKECCSPLLKPMRKLLISREEATKKFANNQRKLSELHYRVGKILIHLKENDLLPHVLQWLENKHLLEIKSIFKVAAFAICRKEGGPSPIKTLQSTISDIDLEWKRRSALYSQHISLVGELTDHFEKHQSIRSSEENEAAIKQIAIAYAYALTLEQIYGKYDAFYLRHVADKAPQKTIINDTFAKHFETAFAPKLSPESRSQALANAKIGATSTKLTEIKSRISLIAAGSATYRRIFDAYSRLN